MIRFVAFAFIFFISCNTGNQRSNQKAADTTGMKKQLPSDTQQTTIHNISKSDNVDTTINKTPAIVTKRKFYTRYGTAPANENYCGKQLVEQIDLHKKVFEKSSDTVTSYLKKLYTVYESDFPKYLTYCDPKSTEIYTGPVLNFSVELFEDEYAAKPYLVICYSVKKQKNGIIIVE